jgi:prevent-host-death family protein
VPRGVEHEFVKTVNITEAKTQLSRLLRRVAAGEEITIAKRGVPVARLVPVAEPTRKPGAYRGAFKVPDDFDAPLPDYLLDLFEGREPKRAKKS